MVMKALFRPNFVMAFALACGLVTSKLERCQAS